MKYENIDACWEALDNAVKRLNEGKTTLDEIVKEFDLEEWRPGQYLEPRWGWPIGLLTTMTAMASSNRMS